MKTALKTPTPSEMQQILSVTEKTNSFLLGQFTDIKRVVTDNEGEILSDKDQLENLRYIETFESSVGVLANNKLSLTDPDDRRRIRSAIANLYGLDMPAYVRATGIGETVQRHLKKHEEDFKVVYKWAGGRTREFDSKGFNPEDETHLGTPEYVEPYKHPEGRERPKLRVDDTPLSPGRRLALAGIVGGLLTVAGGGYVAYKYKKPPEFLLGREAVAMKKGDDKSALNAEAMGWVRQIADATPNSATRTAVLEKVEKMMPDDRGAIIGRVYIEALNENKQELAEFLAQNSKTLRTLQFKFKVGDSRFYSDKNYSQLALEGFTNSLAGGNDVVAKRKDWVPRLAGLANEAAALEKATIKRE